MIREFLAPNRRKWKIFGIELLIILIPFVMVLLSDINIFRILIAPFFFILILPFSVIFSVMPLQYICILLVFSYLFACIVNDKEKLRYWYALFFVSLIALSFPIVAVIPYYNEVFGHTCSKDTDCIVICNDAHNYNYIELSSPFFTGPLCSSWTPAYCDSGKCNIVDIDRPKSAEQCQLIKNEQIKSTCIANLNKTA